MPRNVLFATDTLRLFSGGRHRALVYVCDPYGRSFTPYTLYTLYTLRVQQCQEAIFVLEEKQLFMLQITREVTQSVVWH